MLSGFVYGLAAIPENTVERSFSSIMATSHLFSFLQTTGF